MTDKVTLVLVGDADVGKTALAVRVSSCFFPLPLHHP
jgi:GTPase SAR1 family protein